MKALVTGAAGFIGSTLAERLVAEGADVRRYCVWSFLDNFEWEDGYAKRFGIVHVDYATQQRTVKRSGLWYRDLIARSRNGDGRNEWPASASQA